MHQPKHVSFLDSFINFEQNLHERSVGDFKLDRMHALLDAVGQPHTKLRVVHVAGSKGKGSTCAMLAQILSHAGYRTGLYTSPHLKSYHERIRILGDKFAEPTPGVFSDAITDVQLDALIEEYGPSIEQMRDSDSLGSLTFYEVFTALAFLHFVKEQSDIVILETGLGGRLDATNTVSALVAVLTTIGLEHTEILGETLEAIATEKAAIIKRDQMVVVAPQKEAAEHVINAQCESMGIVPLHAKSSMITSSQLSHHDQKLSIQTPQNSYPDLTVNLVGRHQGENALTALLTAEALNSIGYNVTRSHMYAGLETVSWPLRFEKVDDKPTVILDSAHSVDSFQELQKTLVDVYRGRTLHVVLGLSMDKMIEEICTIVNQMAVTVHLTKSKHARAHTFTKEEMQKYFNVDKVVCNNDAMDCIERAVTQAQSSDVVVVAGSVFLAAEARKRWDHQNNEFITLDN